MQTLEMGTTRKCNSSWPDSTTSQSWGHVGRVLLVRSMIPLPITFTQTDSPAGGHHFRVWKQNGTLANSGAWFIGYVLRSSAGTAGPDLKFGCHSASKEEPTAKKHMIVPNGYNIGRDWFVEKATAGSHWQGMWWKADVEWRQGLLEPGKHGEQAQPPPRSFGWSQMVSHNLHLGVNHGIEQDGVVAILTIHRL